MPSSKKKDERSKFTKACIDIFAGTIAGINVTLVGHPFDTLKIRLQMQPQKNPIYSGLIDCFVKTIKWEGPSGLYKGMTSPLVGQMFFRALKFLSYGEAKRIFSNNGKKILSILDYYICGAIAWGISAFAECPIDFYKTQMQVQIIRAKTIPNFVPEYLKMSDCFKKIVAHNGILGSYQGIIPHLIRNIPGGSINFGTFELLRIKFAERRKCLVNELPVKYNLIAGSLAGLAFWGIIYPVDVVKSSIQSDSPYADKKRFKGVADVIDKLKNEGGIKRFYKGFSPCIIRSIPASSVLLFTSSWITEHI